MKAEVSQSKQSTIDDLSFQFNIDRDRESSRPTKAIIINQITNKIEETELVLKVEFSLKPSNTAFSKINLDLYFEEQLIKSTPICIPQSNLLCDSLEFPLFVDMRGIVAGSYLVRVEMYEVWDSSEKLCFSEKEIVVDYAPQSKESQLVKIPTVKSVAGAEISVVSSTVKSIYEEINEDEKRESISKRDEW
ncbi:MAG TPA: hypothetical protein VLU95_07400 [Candidatus Acidoferrum sp.]|nr:hypothetical protein [Candidatus Acidoferrum sp.]